jgi:putative methyltransferase (TIGR04325 family)
MSLRSRIKNLASVTLARFSSPLEGEFRSFEAAAAASHSTYENRALVDLVAAKTATYRDMILAAREPLSLSEGDVRFGLTLHLASRCRSSLTVVDFGGACGGRYYLAKRLLGPDASLSWKVVETPMMAEVARNRFETSGLAFFDNLGAATRDVPHVDLVHCGNVLQYLRTPFDTLTDLLNIHARFISLASVATCAQARRLFFLQRSRLSENGPGRLPAGVRDRVIRYPFAPLPEQTLAASAHSHYRVELCMEEARYLYHRACGRISYRNYLLSA